MRGGRFVGSGNNFGGLMSDPVDYGLPEPEEEIDDSDYCGEITRCKHCTQPKFFTSTLLFQTHMSQEHPQILAEQQTTIKVKPTTPKPLPAPSVLQSNASAAPSVIIDHSFQESILLVDQILAESAVFLEEQNRTRALSDPIRTESLHQIEGSQLSLPSNLDVALLM